MILKFILDIIISIISFLFTTIANILPNIDFVRYYKIFFELIGEYMQIAVNFVYFIIGEAMFPLLTIAMFLLTYRYVIFPVVVVIRRVFIKGGDT